MANMMVQKFLISAFFFGFIQENLALQCPPTCQIICTSEVVRCKIDHCRDPVFVGSTLQLSIQGTLCKSQRRVLEEYGQYSKIYLWDDVCGSLHQCK